MTRAEKENYQDTDELMRILRQFITANGLQSFAHNVDIRRIIEKENSHAKSIQ